VDLKNLSVEELLKLISPSSDVIQELRARDVLRTKNIVGEAGEYYAIKFYNKVDTKIYEVNKQLPNLTLAGKTTKNVDALSRDGKIYSIKCVSSSNGTTGSFWNPDGIRNNDKTFDYLVIVILDEEYGVDKILELSWEDFMKYKSFNKRMNNFNISVTKKLTEKFKVIYKK
tara:strand:- start:312 stop:824 length:513 start_codon:yes stop_codon:yes gene_type:complete